MEQSEGTELEPHVDSEIADQRLLPVVLRPETELFDVVSMEGSSVEGQGSAAPRTAVVAKCRECFKTFNGFVEVTSNFVTHLKRMHPEAMKILDSKRRLNVNSAPKRRKVEANAGQRSLLGFYKKAPAAVQEKVNTAIINYVVHSICPLNTVDKPQFVDLVTTLAAMPSMKVEVMSRRTVTRKLDDHYHAMGSKLRRDIATVEDLACTADVWSSQGRSFMGITLHYFGENLQRVRLGIACRRFEGSHTFEAVANSIENIFDEFGLLPSRVRLLTTDNATNFVKAFKEFGPSSRDSQEGSWIDDQASGSELSAADEIGDLEVLLMPEYSAEQAFRLPTHERCASHTLSLVAVRDADLKKFIDPGVRSFVELCRRSVGKCMSLWNRLSRSDQGRESCKLTLRRSLTLPCATRWNSLFDSLTDILRDKREDINILMTKLKLPVLSLEEYNFLGIYKGCLEPIAQTLDVLQGDENITYGCLLPAIRKLCSQLRRLEGSVGICEPLRRRTLESVETRFADVLDVGSTRGERALIAAVSHPFFKLRFLAPHEREDAKTLFTAVVRKWSESSEEVPKNSTRRSRPSSLRADPLERFFGYEESMDESATQESQELNLEVEIARYLTDDRCELETLFKYKRVLRVFRAYNVGLPSSAPVERLFSVGSLTLGDLRGRLTDSHLEMLVLFHYNNYKFQ